MDFNIICIISFFAYNYISFVNHNKLYKCHECKKRFKIKEKQLAYYTSTKVSLTLFLTSLFFNILLIKNKFNFNDYEQTLLQNNLNIIPILTTLYFISYLMFDLTIGHIYYRNSIGLLEGYIHHIVYIFISFYTLYSKNTNLFILFFIEELPTFIRSLGSYNVKYRNDNLFGSSFLLFRIIYHVILIYFCCLDKLYSTKILLPLSILTLTLHVYWWKNWIKKYVHKKQKLT